MANSKYSLSIYPKAREDLENIFRYISEDLCNPEAALKLIDDIESSLDRVCYNPFMYSLVENKFIKDHTLRKLIVSNYLVFYRPDEQAHEIQVIRVLYGMSDY